MYIDQLNYNILYSVCIFSFKLRFKATSLEKNSNRVAYNEDRNEFMKIFIWISSNQAWPSLCSHLWHPYLASTPPSSPCSSTCVSAQVATSPQVPHGFYLIDRALDDPQTVCKMLVPPSRHFCSGELDDWFGGGAAGSHTSGDEHQSAGSSWVWGPEDRRGLGRGPSLRNYHGKGHTFEGF